MKRPLTNLTRAETSVVDRASLLVMCLLLVTFSGGAQEDGAAAGGPPSLDEQVAASPDSVAAREPAVPVQLPLLSDEQPGALPGTALDDQPKFLAGLDAEDEVESGGGSPASGWLQFLEVLTALCIVLLGICVVVWVLRRFVGRGPVLLDRRVGRVVGRLYLSPKNVIFLVHVADRIMMVGTAPNTMTCLAEITDPAAVAQIVEGRTAFAESLERAGKQIAAGTATRHIPESVEEHVEEIEHQLERLKALGENEADTS